MVITGIRSTAIDFVFSPLQETLRAIAVFMEPRRHAQQVGWVREARKHASRATKAEIRRVRFLFQPEPELFASLFPSRRATRFDDELALLERNTQDFERSVVRRFYGKRRVRSNELTPQVRTSMRRRVLEETGSRSFSHLHREVCSLIANFFDECLSSQWDDFQRLAMADANARRRLLRRDGVAAMLRTLTPQLGVSGMAREANIRFGDPTPADGERAFDDRATLSLSPSYFIWPHATFVVLRGDGLSVRIAYPLASPESVRPHSLYKRMAQRFAALGDPTRLEMLNLLGSRPRSTRELAGLVSLTEGGASRHLSILRDAGLVTSVRDGYFVLYRRTQMADELLS
ncbi:MAG: winged helix-turn-helix transcriptional regulator [Candidatus Eremiobacteraeota bacterium]|nr:winged helix-turn-helix transcriptional regulator [Candidatus Eremiobacteraeota bacterium]